MATRSGRLRQRVTLQKPVTIPDSTGQVIGWTDVATVWAAVEPARGKEMLGSNLGTGSQKVVNETAALVVIRYRADVDATWRLLHGTTPYGIVSMASPLSLKEVLELTCRRVDTGEPV